MAGGDDGEGDRWVALVDDFVEAAEGGFERLDVGAALIGALIEPEWDPAVVVAALDEAATDVVDTSLDGLLGWFRRTGFSGDRSEHYQSPRNSSLGSVLRRRQGIPISLSVVLMEIGRRVGVELAGVGMPGHFLLRDPASDDVFVDAFDDARIIDRARAETIHRRLHGTSAGFHPSFLAVVGTDLILLRMLNNLRRWYLDAADLDALRWVLRLMDAIDHRRGEERRRLAALLAGRARFLDSATELEALAAEAEAGSERLETLLRDAARMRARLN